MNHTEEDAIYRIALGMMKGCNASIVKRMVERGVTPREFFTLDLLSVYDALGLNSKNGFGANSREDSLQKAKNEYQFVSRHSIRVLSLADDDYPWLLAEIPDAPVTLYMLGDAELNPMHSASIVGTRKPTKYGMSFCSRFCTDLCGYFPDLSIVSGLALGIDAAAHTAALDSGCQTIAVG